MNKDKHRNIWMKRIKDKRNFVRKGTWNAGRETKEREVNNIKKYWKGINEEIKVWLIL